MKFSLITLLLAGLAAQISAEPLPNHDAGPLTLTERGACGECKDGPCCVGRDKMVRGLDTCYPSCTSKGACKIVCSRDERAIEARSLLTEREANDEMDNAQTERKRGLFPLEERGLCAECPNKTMCCTRAGCSPFCTNKNVCSKTC